MLPIVVNLKGGRPGITRRKVVDRVDGEVVATLHYYVLGLEKSVAEDFLEQPEPLSWGLAALMSPRSGDRADQKLRCLERIAQGRLGEKREQMLLNVVETYLQLEGEERARYDELLANEASEEARAMDLTWAGKLEAKGRAEGRAAGKAEGMRELLVRIAERRFGPLPTAVKQRLSAIQDPEELGRMSDRLLEARSLAELGLTA